MSTQEVAKMANGARDDRISTDGVGVGEKQWTVEGVVATLPGGSPQIDSTSPIPFFHILERLKTTKREGWRRFGITHGESISDHMYRMSLITMFAPPALASKLDIPRCTKMALIHDIAELLVGDITPVDGVTKIEKNRRESTTMDYLTKSLLGRYRGGLAGEEMRATWQEYEDSKTLESQFVHDVDKIELVLQMVEYERVHERKLDLGEFSWVASRVVLPECKEWADELIKEREVFWDGKEHTTYQDTLKQEHKALEGHVDYYGNENVEQKLEKVTGNS